MELLLLIAVTTVVTLLIIICSILIRSANGKQKKNRSVEEAAVEQRHMRRVVGNRNVRRRLNVGIQEFRHEQDSNIHDNEEDDASIEETIEFSEGKIGTKKRAKLAAKAQKRALREADTLEKEKRKQEEEKKQKERDRQREEEKAEELRREEAAKKEKQLKEQQEHEEYLKMKEMFSIEEEGFQESQEIILTDVKRYIKDQKVVYFDDVAAHFSLKTSFVVEKMLEWQVNGELTGVIDDQGKFIYITEEELEAVAKFIERRGRVSITELSERSNTMIHIASA